MIETPPINPTYQVTIYIAGDVATARAYLRREAHREFLCVTLTPLEFLYTGSVESGMAIGFVHYHEIKTSPAKIYDRARTIAVGLVEELCQRAALIVATDKTEWIHREPPGAYPR